MKGVVKMKVTNKNGILIDFESSVNMMDDEIREELNREDYNEQEFFTAYEAAHGKKFGEEWELSKANPVW